MFWLLVNEAKFVFNDMSMEAFTYLKGKLTSAPMIVALCNASSVALGAMSGKRKDKMFYPIYYASKA